MGKIRNKITPEIQFIFIVTIIIIVIGIITNNIIASNMKKYFTNERRDLISANVSQQAQHHLNKDIFLSKDFEAIKPEMEYYLEQVSSWGVFHVKIFNRDNQIVFSNESELIGQKFDDNIQLRKALSGEVIVELKNSKNEEYAFEQQYGDFMEVYAPLYFEDEDSPVGVVELYYDIESFSSQVRRMQLIILISVGLALTIIFIIIVTAFNLASRKITSLVHDFVYLASHDLRTPALTMKWHAGEIEEEVKKKNFNKKEISKKAKTINKTADHLLSLTKDILEVSKGESKQVKPDFQSVDMIKITDEVIQEVTSLIEEYNVSVQHETIGGAPPVMADSDQIKEVMTNLITNAVKYNKKKGGKALVKYEKKGSQLITQVIDNGLGMGKDDIKHLYTKFWRSKEAKGQGKGTGLGLFIVKGLIDKMNGKIWVESKKGEGTTFYFSLPIDPKEK